MLLLSNSSPEWTTLHPESHSYGSLTSLPSDRDSSIYKQLSSSLTLASLTFSKHGIAKSRSSSNLPTARSALGSDPCVTDDLQCADRAHRLGSALVRVRTYPTAPALLSVLRSRRSPSHRTWVSTPVTFTFQSPISDSLHDIKRLFYISNVPHTLLRQIFFFFNVMALAWRK